MILNNSIYLLFRIITDNLLMKKSLVIVMLVLSTLSFSQQEDEQLNIAQTQLLNLADLQSGLTIGGYGEINYNDFDTGCLLYTSDAADD